MRPQSPRLAIVVPARNEARNLEVVLPALPRDAQVVLVDGHSVDDTVAVTRRLRPDATILTQTRRGKGNALACGFAAVDADVVVMFDADGSADPAEIPAFVAALTAGADVARGSRFARTPGAGSDDITPLRRAGNAGLNALANLALGTRHSDLCYGYNAFWADMVAVLDLPDPALPAPAGGMLWGDGFEIETLLACRFARAGAVVAEVASTERRRIHGETNLRTFADGFRVLRTLAREVSRRRPAPAASPTLVDVIPAPVAPASPAPAPVPSAPARPVPAARPARSVLLAPEWVQGPAAAITVPAAPGRRRHSIASSFTRTPH